MASLIPHPALGRRLVAALVVGITVGFAFVAFFTSALHDPEPNALRVGVRRSRFAARRGPAVVSAVASPRATPPA